MAQNLPYMYVLGVPAVSPCCRQHLHRHQAPYFLRHDSGQVQALRNMRQFQARDRVASQLTRGWGYSGLWGACQAQMPVPCCCVRLAESSVASLAAGPQKSSGFARTSRFRDGPDPGSKIPWGHAVLLRVRSFKIPAHRQGRAPHRMKYYGVRLRCRPSHRCPRSCRSPCDNPWALSWVQTVQ